MKKSNTNRIYSGENALPGEVPWQALLQRRGIFACGGTLVGRKHVITAAHCVYDSRDQFMYEAKELTVVLGINNRFNETGLKSNVEKVMMHPEFKSIKPPNYDREVPENDIAVLVLTENIRFLDYKNIRPACLPDYKTSDVNYFKDQTGIISGWGRMRTSNVVASLQKAVIEVMGNDCSWGTWAFKPGRLCAGDLTSKKESNNNNKDTCKGDSGGPLTVQYGNYNNAETLIGVTSFSIGNCGGLYSPGFYAYVPFYNGWLSSVMSDLKTCPPPPKN